MIRIELNAQEADTLREVIESSLSELRSEISHTDTMAFREKLRQQTALLEQILGRLHRPPSASGTFQTF